MRVVYHRLHNTDRKLAYLLALDQETKISTGLKSSLGSGKDAFIIQGVKITVQYSFAAAHRSI